MDLGLQGKSAAVVGGTRGIGRAIAEQLIAEGANVSICARSADGVDAAIREMSGGGTHVHGAALDVADGAAQERWIAETAKAAGGLDMFIANASAMDLGNSAQAWKKGFEVDLLGTFHGVEAAIPHLIEGGAGSIVFITSIAALQAPNGPKPYGAMKAALINYAKGLARVLAPEGIRVNCVSPGNIYFEGGIWAETEARTPRLFKRQLAANPMGRMGTPEEVANAAVFLSSPAARYISGTNLIVDGALTVGVQY